MTDELSKASLELRSKTPSQMVEIIEKIDQLIANMKKQIETLTKLRATLLLEWYGETEKRKVQIMRWEGREWLIPGVLQKLWERLQQKVSA